MRRPREQDLTRACLEYLTLLKIPAWRQNAGGLSVVRGGRRHYYQFAGAAGVSDILGILPPSGRLIAVETKSPTGRLTKDQRAFLDAVCRAGGVGIVVRSLDDLTAALAAEGIL